MFRSTLPVICLLLLACSDYGVTRSIERDAILQDDGNLEVDVVWVMDNSGTMSEEQDNVVANLSEFVDVLDGFGADWQVGVVTTNVESAGGQIVAPIVTPYVADVANTFAAAVAVGATGSRDEQGLHAMLLATTEPTMSEANAGLIRDTADLAVIIVSDEDDHSPESLEFYQQHMERLKSGRARLSAVVGQLPAGCASPYAAADPAERYLSMVEWSGGIADSICRQDFGSTMKQLALNVMGLTDTFPLSQVPEPDSLEVRREGVKLYERELNGWQYDPGLNAIIVDGYAIPGPGEQLDVSYYAWQGNVAGDTAETPTE